MSSTDNEKLIKPIKIYLICGGAWQRPLTNPILDKIYKIYTVFVRITFLAFCLLIWAEFLRLVIQRYDRELLMSCLVIVINVAKIAAKVGIYLKNKVISLFDDVISKEETVWASDDDEIKICYNNRIAMCQKCVAVQALLSGFAAVAVQVIGIYGNLKLREYNRTHNETLETHFDYQYWLPVDKLENIWLFLSIQEAVAWAGYVYNCITHMILSVLLIFLAVHLEIFQIRVRKFIPSDESNVVMDHVVLDLKALIKEHQFLIKYAIDLKKWIRSIIFMEYVLSSIDMASAVVNLIKVDSLEGLSQQLGFVVLLTVQIFILAYNANEVKIQSENITDALFESSWFILNKKECRLIQFMMARAQKSLVMNIGPFGAMTTQSGLTMMRAAYSYVSIMKP